MKVSFRKKISESLGIIRIDEKIDFKPGQFFNIVFQTDGELKARPYSAASSPKQDHTEFYVKAMEDGRVAKHLLNLEIGGEVELRGPHGHFTLQESENDIYMICAGSGVAPLMSMARHLQLTEDPRKVLFLNGASHKEELGYLDTLRKLSEETESFTYLPTLSQEEWDGKTGRVEDHLNLIEDTAREVYICGPPPMVVNVTKALLEKGFLMDNIHTERYY